MKRFDAVVLGAGMVGISAALHLQKAGRTVALVDRRRPAEETSHGNAGLIQREGIVPYSFPRDLTKIVNYAFNLLPEAHLHWRALPWLAPFLARYWANGSPERVAATARAMRPLVERSLIEHEALMQEAGVASELRRTGFLRVFRSPRRLEEEAAKEEAARKRYGVEYALKDAAGIAAMEPDLSIPLAGGLHMPQPASVASPGRIGKAYADLFLKLGGTWVEADACGLSPGSEAWTLPSARLQARDAVLALGPWTAEVAARLGVRLPMGFKRGYHMRYAPPENGARLNHPLQDAENGYLMTPEDGAIRLTTGAEFARLDAPSTPVQLGKVEPIARALFPLGARLLDTPWRGARPCFPDLVPMIGPVPGHPRLWLNTGHHHLGFTLGPVSGRLLAAMMTGETSFTDPAPYRADRFG
jgi:D-amino-acid dehydrogenase